MKKLKLVVVIFFLFIGVLSAQERRYEIESAIIKKEAVSMGQKVQGITYFDDFGRKESTEIIMIPFGTNEEKRIRSIMEGKSIITIDLNLRTATRVELPIKPINYLSLTTDIREEYEIKEIGSEEIVGKECQKYSLVIKQMGQVAEMVVWVWKGILLKSETSSNGMLISVETATEIIEGLAGHEEKLEMPEDITI